MKRILKSTTLLALASFSLLGSICHAQDNTKKNTDNTSENRRFWEANVSGGNYMVALDRISSISMHTYVLGGFLIHEVDIDTNGAALARFYTIDLVGADNKANIAKNLADRAKDIAKRGGNRAGVDPATTTEKTPATTHAKTIEYKLATKSDLDQLYNSLKRALREGRGRKFSIK